MVRAALLSSPRQGKHPSSDGCRLSRGRKRCTARPVRTHGNGQTLEQASVVSLGRPPVIGLPRSRRLGRHRGSGRCRFGRRPTALPQSDQALWATALYAGLRRGELRALQWDDIDLPAGVIHVRRSMDARGSIIAPKSSAGVRAVPIAKVLRGYLAGHRLRNGSVRYVFGSGDRPFGADTVAKRARNAWAVAKMDAIGLHDARYAAASVLIAAGVNPKALSVYMGHSSITITLDRYGHLFPGNEGEAAGLVDAYLEGVGVAP